MSPADVARDAVGALKGSPALLVIVLLNVALGVAALLYLRAEQRQMDRMIEIVSTCARPAP